MEVIPASPILFTRDDENRMNILQTKLSEEGTLPPDEKDEFLSLVDKCAKFEEEGLRRLQDNSTNNSVVGDGSGGCGVSPRSRARGGGGTTGTSTSGGTVSSLVHGTQFWGSLIATAVPGYLGRKLGFTNDFLHWNFITEEGLILGALPVVSQFGKAGDHLTKLAKQLAERRQTLGLVVSCIQPEEFEGYGVNVIEFAKHKDWVNVFGDNVTFCHIPMQDFGAGVTFDQLLAASEMIHDVIHNQKKVVYVHCKAGKGRSWVLTMAYLIAKEGLTYEAAEALVKTRRHQVNPGTTQVEKVKDFAMELQMQKKMLMAIRAEEGKRMMREDEFNKLRASVQSVPVQQRKVLLKDLQELDYDVV